MANNMCPILFVIGGHTRALFLSRMTDVSRQSRDKNKGPGVGSFRSIALHILTAHKFTRV